MTETRKTRDLVSWLTLLVFLVISVLLVAIYVQIRGMKDRPESPAGSTPSPSAATRLSESGGLVYRRVVSSVVAITATNAAQTPAANSAMRQRDREHGTGVIVHADGYVLTSLHVVSQAVRITIKLDDGRNLVAEVVGSDDETDLALLHVDATQLRTASWGDSDALEIGAVVWTISNPFGLEWSLSFGIVSGLKRKGIGPAAKSALVQTDAATAPGSSGGALVDQEGRIMGINSAILGKEFQGVSLAVPSNQARRVTDVLLEKAGESTDR